MAINEREFWMMIHLILGAIYLHAFAGGITGLIANGKGKLGYFLSGTWIMAIVSWLTVIIGTYIVYPWYRVKPPADVTDLNGYTRSYFLADPNMMWWHKFGMEWKEHIGWISPILATAVAFIVIRYGSRLAKDEKIRKAATTLFTIAFVAAGIAGLLGALINKVAPNTFLDLM